MLSRSRAGKRAGEGRHVFRLRLSQGCFLFQRSSGLGRLLASKPLAKPGTFQRSGFRVGGFRVWGFGFRAPPSPMKDCEYKGKHE